MKKSALLATIVVSLVASAVLAANPLKVIKAGPVGEIANLAEANEIRIVFSEPMVVIGKVPSVVTAPFFHIAPAVKGSFRWSGTNTLIFTPDAKSPLPYATQFDVTIDETAKSVAGNALDRAYAFSFMTPTIKLVNTDWYRKGGRYDGSIVIGLRFNQPVTAEALVPHLKLQYALHSVNTPEIPRAGVERLLRLEPQAGAAFDAKVAQMLKAAGGGAGNVLAFIATEWDTKRMPKKPELIVLETKPGIPPSSAIKVSLDPELAQKSTAARSAQEFTIELEPMLFVKELSCIERCNPEGANWIRFYSRSGLVFAKLAAAIAVIDVTDPQHEKRVEPSDKTAPEWRQTASEYSLDELGYSLLPAHTYAVRIDPTLEAVDGQKLGYTFMAVVDYTHKMAFISFGEGHGVWESTGGPQLPFYARNYRSVTQWLAPVAPQDVMPTIMRLQKHEGSTEEFRQAPDTQPHERKLAPTIDKVQSIGINVGPVLKDGKGVVWAAVQEGEAIPGTKPYWPQVTHATLVQVTNLGLTVKDSPLNTLIFVTRLDDGAPVAGATVSIRTTDNKVVWSGTSDEHGLAIAPNTNLRRALPKREEAKPQPEPQPEGEASEEGEEPNERDQYVEWENSWDAIGKLHFIVTAEKSGDFAYVASNWNEGIGPYDFAVDFRLSEADPLLRGTIFADRGVYKLGEEVHLKTVLRSDTPSGMQLLAKGTAVSISVRDSHGKTVDKRSVTLNEWSSAEWTWQVPADGVLGTYRVSATVEGQHLQTFGSFLVAAYRRPDFRVDTTLKGASSIAGVKLDGVISGRYLFGSPMSRAELKWTYTKSQLLDVPAKIRDRFPEEQYVFLGYDESGYPNTSPVTISSKEQKLTAGGELKLALDTDLGAGEPYSYTLEGEVTDVSRQKIAGRASSRVDPAPWYIGIHMPDYFADVKKGVDVGIVAAGLDATGVAGVTVQLALKQIQFNSVRQAEGNGYYSWQVEKKEVPSGSWTVTTTAAPAPLHIPVANGGYYILTATASDGHGRSTKTRLSFYALGEGYTAWERYDHNRIDLIPERKTYRPGETARIMIKSPWEHATALLTTEREGVRTHKEFKLTSTQQSVSVPISEKDIPNVYVSVVLIKGRTKEGSPEDASDPGKPTFRVGYTELKVEDATKRLKVDVKANSDSYRPASKAKIEVDVHDMEGKASQSEVTLWAVDYGVLSLTAYKTPDVLGSIYLNKALQVVNDDSRQKIISRRVITPKGEDTGGGGGKDTGPGVVRKDFRVLAFWLGSLTTDAKGHLKTEVTLPESLTTYRIMAVAGDRASRFGWAQNEIKINKPVLLTAAFPRFLAVGDKAYFGAVVHSQLPQNGSAVVTIKSLDPSILEFTGDGKATTDVAAGGAVEVRFNAVAKAVGNARVQMTVSMSNEKDAFEDVIPVRVLASIETVAAYGEAKETPAKETLEIPGGVLPGVGGMHMELSSTAMVGLGEGARYLVDYPYGCAEQRASSAIALMLASDLGDAFTLPGIDAAKIHGIAQTTLNELPKFQCGNGGFTYWAGECRWTSPYLTSYVLHVMQRGQKLKYNVSAEVLDRGYKYLEENLALPRPTNESWWPSYTSWQAFAVKVLVEGGRNEDSHITRLYGFLDRMPLFGVAYLADAMIAKGETGNRLDELHRRLSNSILPEGGSAHVEELNDPMLVWFWSSNARSTAIVLDTLVRHGQDEQIVKRMVRWLMQVRKRGRWGNTQENALAMESLVDYYRRYEGEIPDFTAVVTIGSDAVARDAFKGRSAKAKPHDFSMADVLARGKAGQQLPVTLDRKGTGTLFYLIRLKYASDLVQHNPMDQGFSVERSYAGQNAKTPSLSFKAGDLIKVTLKIRNTKERQYVAVTDPIPAGTEPVESWFATTSSELTRQQQDEESQHGDWMAWYTRGGFDHVERHDDHVDLFATMLSEGPHEFSYLIRATTAGTFITAPAHAEEMYEPEVFGRTATATVEVKP